MTADRGLAFGDGLFETLRVVSGRAPLADWHWQRLADSARRLGLPCEAARWQDGLAQLLDRHAGADGIIKLIFSAGAGGRGYARPASVQPAWHWSWHEPAPRPDQLYRNGMALALSEVRLSHQPLLAGMKHLNRLEQVLARQAMPRGVDEVLMCDASGRPLALSCMNIYARFGDTLWTPALAQAGVAGVARRLLLEDWLAGSGLRPSHRICTLSQLAQADEVFASNAVAGVLPIRKLGVLTWPVGSACRHFQSRYQQLLGLSRQS
jgi:4-amino-4-deoxychorismate lyase